MDKEQREKWNILAPRKRKAPKQHTGSTACGQVHAKDYFDQFQGMLLKRYAQAEGVSNIIGWRFGVDLESASDLSHRIGVSETAEYWEKVQGTSARPHVDVVPGRNRTGTCLTHADT